MIALLHRLKKTYHLLVDRPYPTQAIVADRYKILKTLGMGSFGITYLCEDLTSGTNCVLKQMRPSKNKSKSGQQLYHNEISILGSLYHPCIPKLYHHFPYENHLFYTMEFIDGSNLEDVLFAEHSKFKEKDALLLLKQILDIIEYLHFENIVHNDIRIPNMMLWDENLYLIDFGLASKLDGHENGAKGTRERMELIQDDFYDLGDVLLYLLYSFYVPLDRKSRPWTEELTLQPSTKHILERLLAIKDPYENTSDIRKDLDQALS
ncbi:serine/threonine protein kinase [Virgibacillus necropolis]|uniref:Protein kinase n=1 Tax=Virgibacillus necropolis TaxID=163877 RepID=A0A221M7G4_9BACI|nr:protein kinase [Virgibacillus necropolis]ASN03583.1 protein kinase [Virgibacillus necropolis]